MGVNLRKEEQRQVSEYVMTWMDSAFSSCTNIWSLWLPCLSALGSLILIPLEKPITEKLRRMRCPCMRKSHGILYDNLVKTRRAEGRMASFNPRAHEEYAAAFKLIDLTAAQQDHDRLSPSSEDSSSCSSTTEEDEYEEEEHGLWSTMFG